VKFIKQEIMNWFVGMEGHELLLQKVRDRRSVINHFEAHIRPLLGLREGPMGKRYPDVEPIPDTPENIARSIMQGPPKEEWDFEKAREAEEAQPVDSEGGG